MIKFRRTVIACTLIEEERVLVTPLHHLAGHFLDFTLIIASL